MQHQKKKKKRNDALNCEGNGLMSYSRCFALLGLRRLQWLSSNRNSYPYFSQCALVSDVRVSCVESWRAPAPLVGLEERLHRGQRSPSPREEDRTRVRPQESSALAAVFQYRIQVNVIDAHK